jgi:beta-aspartyl-peptidase (threonine type)
MKPTILLHGGSRSTLLDLEFDEERKQTLNTLVGYGRSLLNDGKDAITVAEAIIVQMEDAPFFNAGKGSALNVNGSHEVSSVSYKMSKT